MIIGFGNNTVSSLAADITANQTTIQVMPGEGAKFAKLLSSDYVNTSNPLKVYAKITLTDAKETVFEVCHLTAVNNDMLTVVRGQEGTTAKGWALNDVVANFATRGSENQFVQIEQLQSGNYTSAVAGGSANALTIELPATYFINSSTDWALRTPIVVYPTQNNTGASTLQLVMGGRVLGTFPLYKGNKAQLVANDILKDVGLVCLMDKTKTFFNVANPGAIYAGLGTAAFKDVQTSNEDRTPDRVLLTGNALPTIKTPLSVDLNTLGGYNQDGVYYQSSDANATADKHYPIQLSGTLSVTPSAYGCQQEYTTYSTSRKFMRSLLGVWNGSGPWSPWVEAYSESHKPTPSEISAVPSAGGSVGYLDGATYYDTKPDVVPRGSGGWDSQLNSGAPFYAPNWAWPVNSGGHYVPLVKGVSTRAGIGYPCAVSFGYLLPGDDTWASPVIHAKGDNSECTWQFNINTGEIWSSKAGTISTQTDAQNRANDAYSRATTWAYQNQVGNVQVSGIWEYVDIPYPGQANVPSGTCPVAYVGTTKSTGSGISFHISRIYFCRIQKVINGVAYNIA